MALSLDRFRQYLVASQLLSTEEISAFLKSCPAGRQPADGQQFATELVRQGKLTRFQAQRIYRGKGQRLVFGNYVILDALGAGGMGQVFKAEHRRMKRVVALKTLPPPLMSDPVVVRRFQREVEAVARLSHPDIVTAYDADECRGTHYLVMEYVEGRDLSSAVRELGPMSVRQALDCALQAAAGLEYAHGQGIIHRDIKPSNLLLDSQGTVKILDMGLARIDSLDPGHAASKTELTGSGAIMGTVDYMSPEQAADTRRADHRADIYSLGCTLHYLLTGRPVFERETIVQRLLAHREQEVPSLCRLRPDVPEAVDDVFKEMVAKRPEDRFQSMNEVVVALRACHAPEGSGLSVTGGYLPAGTFDDSGLLGFLQNISAQTQAASTSQAATIAAETVVSGVAQKTTPSAPQPREPAVRPRGHSVVRRSFLAVGGAAAIVAAGFVVVSIVGAPEPDTTSARRPVETGAAISSSPASDLDVARSEQPPAVATSGPESPFIAEAPEADSSEAHSNGGSEDAADRDVPMGTELDRQVAIRFLDLGGAVTVLVDGEAKGREIRGLENLPSRPFAVTRVRLAGKERAVDESTLDGLDRLPKLQDVAFSEVRLAGDWHRSLARCLSIKRLHLTGHCQVSEVQLAELIARLPALTTLNVSWCEDDGRSMDDDVLRVVRELEGLEHLDLSGSAATAADVAALRSLPTLRDLLIGWTKISGSELECLRSARQLRRLNLGSLRGADEAVRILAGHPLQELFLSDSDLTDEGLRHLDLPNLYYLYVDKTEITDEGLRYLSERVSGRNNLHLNFCDTSVSDAGLRHLRALNVKALYVAGTMVTAEGAQEFQQAHPQCVVVRERGE